MQRLAGRNNIAYFDESSIFPRKTAEYNQLYTKIQASLCVCSRVCVRLHTTMMKLALDSSSDMKS